MSAMRFLSVLIMVLSCATLLRAQANTIVLEPKVIHDRASSLEAATLFVPQGWQVNEQILWQLDHGSFVNNVSTIFDPQSGAAIRLLPTDQFNSSPMIAASLRRRLAVGSRSPRLDARPTRP